MLAHWQQDLAERLASLKGHDGEDNPALKARMRDLEQEQKQIRDALAKLPRRHPGPQRQAARRARAEAASRDGARSSSRTCAPAGHRRRWRRPKPLWPSSPPRAATKRPRKPPTSSTSSSRNATAWAIAAGNGTHVSAGPCAIAWATGRPTPGRHGLGKRQRRAWAAYGIGRPLRRTARHVREHGQSRPRPRQQAGIAAGPAGQPPATTRMMRSRASCSLPARPPAAARAKSPSAINAKSASTSAALWKKPAKARHSRHLPHKTLIHPTSRRNDA